MGDRRRARVRHQPVRRRRGDHRRQLRVAAVHARHRGQHEGTVKVPADHQPRLPYQHRREIGIRHRLLPHVPGANEAGDHAKHSPRLSPPAHQRPGPRPRALLVHHPRLHGVRRPP